MEMFGLADVRTLALLEGLPHLEDRCPKFHPIASRSSWQAEAKRLTKEADKQRKKRLKVRRLAHGTPCPFLSRTGAKKKLRNKNYILSLGSIHYVVRGRGFLAIAQGLGQPCRG